MWYIIVLYPQIQRLIIMFHNCNILFQRPPHWWEICWELRTLPSFRCVVHVSHSASAKVLKVPPRTVCCHRQWKWNGMSTSADNVDSGGFEALHAWFFVWWIADYMSVQVQWFQVLWTLHQSSGQYGYWWAPKDGPCPKNATNPLVTWPGLKMVEYTSN